MPPSMHHEFNSHPLFHQAREVSLSPENIMHPTLLGDKQRDKPESGDLYFFSTYLQAISSAD
jgi:hypothetical protein